MLMPSSDFQTYITDLSNVSSEIHFSSNSKAMKLRAIGDFAEQVITINETNEDVTCEGEHYGTYNKKHMFFFIRL